MAVIAVQIDQVLEDLGRETEEELNEEVRRHYEDGNFTAVSAIQSAGIEVAASLSQFDEEAIAAMVDETFLNFGQGIQTAGRDARRILSLARRERIRDILSEGTITGRTRRGISKQIKAELSDGITILRDRRGRKWSMDTYAEMLTRTKMMEARNTGLENRLVRQGGDLVQVSNHNSSHASCARWEGKILSITGESDKYPSVQEAKDDVGADGTSIFHVNCKHRMVVWKPGLSDLR